MSLPVVVGIDFGTSYSGYAFAFTHERKINCHSHWEDQPHSNYPKTMTQLLYAPDGTLVAWGASAQQRLAELRSGKDEAGYRYYRNFKLALLRPVRVGPEGPIGAFDSGEEPVIPLIADFLRKLKELVVGRLQNTTSGHIQETDILWCLTVPAIWTDEAKHWMRSAAQRAGLIGEGSEEAQRLVLTLEPEAGAIRALLLDRGGGRKISELKPGTRMLVMDLGGGTVDLTAYELQPRGGLTELMRGTGDACGSTFVDREFEALLKHRLGAHAIMHLRKKFPYEYLSWTLEKWERAKLGFDPTTMNAVSVDLNIKIYKALNESFPDVMRELQAHQGCNDALVFDKQTMEGLFKPSVSGILKELRNALQVAGPRGFDFIFMVGGFSASKLVVSAVKEALGDQVSKLIIPVGPGGMVVEGAVEYGLDPSVIRARRIRWTYGKGTLLPFDSKIHSEDRRKKNHPELGYDYIEIGFSTFVVQGDEVIWLPRLLRLSRRWRKPHHGGDWSSYSQAVRSMTTSTRSRLAVMAGLSCSRL